MLQGYKTIILAGVAFLAEIAKYAGVTLDIGTQEAMGNSLVVIVTTFAAMYTRYHAVVNVRTGAPLI